MRPVLDAVALQQRAIEVLHRYVSGPTARSVLDVAFRRSGLRRESLTVDEFPRLLACMEPGLRLFVPEEHRIRECMMHLENIAGGASAGGAGPDAASSVFTVTDESDVGRARVAARMVAQRAGFSEMGATRLATVACELARNVARYAGGGDLSLRVLDRPDRAVEIVASDRGPGIADLTAILDGTYRSRTGMGLGLRGVRRLSDQFDVETAPGRGTRVMSRMRVQ